MIRDDLALAVRQALADGALPDPPNGIVLEPPKQRDRGDWATPVALSLAKLVGGAPMEVAQRIVDELNAADVAHLARAEAAMPGFVNLYLAPSWLHDVLRTVVADGDRFGTSDALVGARINLEFVSANPTGPLHAGGGRWVAVGDAIANLLASQGAHVHREYYLNDTGNQLATFRDSLYARYRGGQPPEDGYHGAYLTDLAADLHTERGGDLSAADAGQWGVERIIEGLRNDLARIGVHFDTWFSERTLHERDEVADVLRVLDQRAVLYDKDGARWLRTTEFGDSRDRVLVKSDGSTTYLCNDLAYHRDKLARGSNHLIDIWGADHHGQVKSTQAGMQALGFGPPPEPEVLLGQLVKLVRDGVEVRLSKRAGDIVTLADILDEVDPDVARMTFLLQSIDSPQTFDLDVVTSQSMENPVYYVQYAHARVSSIARRAAAAGIERSPLGSVDLSPLVHEREHELLRALAVYPDVIADAAATRAPQKVSTWVRDFAHMFHGFYRDCRVITDDADLTQARLWLSEACRVGLANALGLLGVSAPDEMARLDDDDESED